MILVLELAGERAGQLGLDSRRVQRDGALVVGRAPTCDWVLPDPEVSGRHARIERVGDRFLLTDSSTNGVHLNGSQERWPPGTPMDLRTGDRIAIGGFEVAVTVLDGDGLPVRDR